MRTVAAADGTATATAAALADIQSLRRRRLAMRNLITGETGEFRLSKIKCNLNCEKTNQSHLFGIESDAELSRVGAAFGSST